MISVRLAQMARSLSDRNEADWGGPIFAALVSLVIECTTLYGIVLAVFS